MNDRPATRLELAGAPANRPARCPEHPAYEVDYCPLCGTATVIGGTR